MRKAKALDLLIGMTAAVCSTFCRHPGGQGLSPSRPASTSSALKLSANYVSTWTGRCRPVSAFPIAKDLLRWPPYAVLAITIAGPEAATYTYRLYQDAACQKLAASYAGAGTFHLTGRSPAVINAVEVQKAASTWTLTVVDADFLSSQPPDAPAACQAAALNTTVDASSCSQQTVIYDLCEQQYNTLTCGLLDPEHDGSTAAARPVMIDPASALLRGRAQ